MSTSENNHIVESGMDFGEIDDNIFYIEKSKAYKRYLSRGVKMVEFVRIKPDEKKLWFVEAKTSLAAQDSIKTPDNFNEEIQKITEKFSNALILFSSIYHGTCRTIANDGGYKELSDRFKNIDLLSMNFLFVLVIKDMGRNTTSSIKDNINRQLKRHNNFWPFNVLVINEAQAKSRNVIF